MQVPFRTTKLREELHLSFFLQIRICSCYLHSILHHNSSISICFLSLLQHLKLSCTLFHSFLGNTHRWRHTLSFSPSPLTALTLDCSATEGTNTSEQQTESCSGNTETFASGTLILTSLLNGVSKFHRTSIFVPVRPLHLCKQKGLSSAKIKAMLPVFVTCNKAPAKDTEGGETLEQVA